MRYTDGKTAIIGDRVIINGHHQGVVVANIDGQEYSPEYPKEQWEYLGTGVLIVTEFGGVLHYKQDNLVDEPIELLNRK